MSQPPRLAVLGTPEALAASAPARHEPLSAGVAVAIVLCGHGGEFEPVGVPAIAWCSAGGRPRLGPDDRWVSASGAENAWRHLPVPVADSVYTDSGPTQFWLGEPSERRVEILSNYPALATIAAETDVAVNLNDAPAPHVEHRALSALAAGRLLVSETLTPGRGLEPGLDYLEVRAPDELFTAVQTVSRRPLAFERMRLRGRAKAAAFEATTLMGRAATDLLLELGRR